jgi:hypothetical protein
MAYLWPMTDESAAGPKTDQAEDRRERVAASLEKQFHACRKETDLWLERSHTEEGYIYTARLDSMLKLFRTSAQLAQVIEQIDRAKNRNSKTQ